MKTPRYASHKMVLEKDIETQLVQTATPQSKTVEKEDSSINLFSMIDKVDCTEDHLENLNIKYKRTKASPINEKYQNIYRLE